MGIMDFLGGGSKSGPTKQDKQFQKEVFNFAKEVGKIPYQPWAGVDVAAFNPQQDAAMQAYADMGNAFGMGMPTDVTAGRPKVYTDASGASGYSGFPAWMQNLETNKNTAAAGRYAKFYDLPVEDLYGKDTNFGSVTGANPAGSGGTPGGKGGAITLPPAGTNNQFANLYPGKGSPFGTFARNSPLEGNLRGGTATGILGGKVS